jgi:hypothetical protein
MSRRRRTELERREWRLVRAYALGELPEQMVGWLWWSLQRQGQTWRWN